MTTLKTVRGSKTEPHAINGKSTCANGHNWEPETTRWRFRDRTNRKDRKGYAGWERDCLVCRRVAQGRRGSGLRSQSWLPGATS